MSDYDNWPLERLRDECKTRQQLLNVSGNVGAMQTESENVDLGTDREVFEQTKSKSQSKTISAPSDFCVGHDYGEKGEIPQGSEFSKYGKQ